MKRPSLSQLSAAYDAQQAALVRWLHALPAEAWERPALGEWSVRELAVHTTEVPGALTRPLADGPVKERAMSIAAYTSIWREAAPEIAARDKAGAVGLSPADVIERHQIEQTAFSAALDKVNGDPVVRARRGPIRVSDFLATRVNELVVHSRDLSAAVPEVEPIAIDAVAIGVSVRMLLDILAERAPGKSVEVRVPPYAAVQCIEGPRHTRGTPPNVVETEPLLWVELASGRVTWTDALATGRVHASGERADISARLPVLG